VNWLDVDTKVERLRFGITVMSLCVVYLIPQITGLYLFARFFAS
jgi:hypothetical protein